MDDNTIPETRPNLVEDDLYFKLWEADQKHTTTRWTVSTFFLSVSFAIFGISFQLDNAVIPRFVPQFTAVGIYWFTYALFLRFNAYTRFLRSYLREMEDSGRTTMELQKKATSYLTAKKSLTSTELLLYFGVVYTFLAIGFGILY